MAHYFPFELDDGTTVLVQVAAQAPTRGSISEVIGAGRKRFADAIRVVKPLCVQIQRELQTLECDETEVAFSLVTTGEFDFAVAKLGAEANFQITLTWKKQ
jgi:hypothetical protein